MLPFFPEDFLSCPRLENRPEWVAARRRHSTEFYKRMETSSMPMSLYSWEQHLYLLAKEAAKNSKTAWSLIKLDPLDGSEISRVRLPTDAFHLTVVPGHDFWALIEKGKFQGIGETNAPYMNTSSMSLIPAIWLENPYAGRLDAELRANCAELPP